MCKLALAKVGPFQDLILLRLDLANFLSLDLANMLRLDPANFLRLDLAKVGPC